MAVQRKYKLNLRNYGNIPAIMISQYDENYNLVFEIYDGFLPASDLSAYTVKLLGTRADELGFEFAGTVSTNTLSFPIDTTMSACSGKGTAEIVIEDTGNDVKFATFNMPLYVEKAARPDGTIDADVERAQEIAAQVQTIVDNAASTVTQSIADAYSASSTYAVGDYCIYNNTLYRCTTAISTAEAWTSGHWTAVTAGDELSLVKRDLSVVIDDTGVLIIDDTLLTSTGHMIASNGALVSAGNFNCSEEITIRSEWTKIVLTKATASTNLNVAFYTASPAGPSTLVTGYQAESDISTETEIDIPDNAKILKVCNRITGSISGYSSGETIVERLTTTEQDTDTLRIMMRVLSGYSLNENILITNFFPNGDFAVEGATSGLAYGLRDLGQSYSLANGIQTITFSISGQPLTRVPLFNADGKKIYISFEYEGADSCAVHAYGTLQLEVQPSPTSFTQNSFICDGTNSSVYVQLSAVQPDVGVTTYNFKNLIILDLTSIFGTDIPDKETLDSYITSVLGGFVSGDGEPYIQVDSTVKQNTENIAEINSKLNSNADHVVYTYSDIGKLTTETLYKNNVLITSRSYTYDDTGNLSQIVETGSETVKTTVYTYDGSGRLAEITITETEV